MACALSETQISLGIFAVRLKKAWVLSYPLSAQRRLIRLGDAQADLNLRWTHSHFVGFVMRRLICLSTLTVLDVMFGKECNFFPVTIRVISFYHGYRLKSHKLQIFT